MLTSTPAWAHCRPEYRVWGFSEKSSNSASQEVAKPLAASGESAACGYDFASGVHKYLYCQGNPIMGWDPSGHELGELSISMGGYVALAGFTAAAVTIAKLHTYSTIYVVSGTVATSSTFQGDEDDANFYKMRLQLQQGTDKHYWSIPIFGEIAYQPSDFGNRLPNKYLPVTKVQVTTALGYMFNQIRSKSYTRDPDWAPYSLGGDESLLWQAIRRMSEFVQTHGPTPSTPDPTWHQEYYNPNDEDSPRIDLENIKGANLGT